MRRAVFIVVLLLVPAAAHADRHRADMFVGGFLAKGSDFKGVQLSGSWPILPCQDWSLVVTYGRYYGTEDDDSADHTLIPFLIGGRKTWHELFGWKETLPFVQVLGGVVDNIRELDPMLREVRSHKIAVFGAGIQPAFPTNGNNKNDHVPRLRVRAQVDFFIRTKEDFSVGKIGGPGVAFSLGLVYQFGPEFECRDKPHGSKKACVPSAPPPQATPAARLVPAERRGPPAPGERIAIGAR